MSFQIGPKGISAGSEPLHRTDTTIAQHNCLWAQRLCGCVSREYRQELCLHLGLKASVVPIMWPERKKEKKSHMNSQTTTSHHQAVLKSFPLWHSHTCQTNSTAIIKSQPKWKGQIIFVHNPKLPSEYIFPKCCSLFSLIVIHDVPRDSYMWKTQHLCSINQHFKKKACI